jgi:hypothetical protein
MTEDQPQYVTRYLGKHVKWFDPPRHLGGTVLNVDRFLVDRRWVIYLRVLRDDGFISPGVDADQLLEVADIAT